MNTLRRGVALSSDIGFQKKGNFRHGAILRRHLSIQKQQVILSSKQKPKSLFPKATALERGFMQGVQMIPSQFIMFIKAIPNYQSNKRTPVWHFVEKTMFSVLGVVGVAIMPPLLAIKRLSDHLLPTRQLTHSEIDVLSTEDMTKVRICEGRSLMGRMYLPDSAFAFVLWDTIYAKAPMSPTTLRHEAIHFLQYKENGLVPFLAKYFADYGTNMLIYKFNTRNAYLKIGFEKEAYKLQELRNLRKSKRYIP